MKYKKGDIVIIAKIDKTKYHKTTYETYKKSWTKSIGSIGIIESYSKKRKEYDLKITTTENYMWKETELRLATKKEIQLYKEALIENEI